MKQEEYWKILSNTNDWIKFSDTKAVVVLTVYGILVTTIYANANDVYNYLSNSFFSIFIASIAIILSVLSILFSFLSINPRLKNSNPSSIIYFGHIQKNAKNSLEYYQNSQDILSDESEYEKQVSEQVFVNSKIAWKKFKNVTYSIRLFFFSILSIFVLIINYFISL